MEKATATVASWPHHSVQSEQIDTEGFPFDPTVFDGQTYAVVHESLVAGRSNSRVPLDSISPHHARSYEIGNKNAVTAVWRDRFGNAYTSLSLKGNNFTTPDIFRSATAPSGFIPKGLQEDDALLRVLKASRILRELAIPTEWIVSVDEPQEIAFGADGFFSQTEYKQRLLVEKLQEQPSAEIALITEAIQNMSFFITARCMEINDRPTDFLTDRTKLSAKQRLEKVFKVYNIAHCNDSGYKTLDIECSSDITQYFGRILPTLKARNLARLHNAGLVHTFPVQGNSTALGGIIDLDSIKGAPLGIGDPEITSVDIINDLVVCFSDEREAYPDIIKHITELGLVESSLDEVLQVYMDSFCQTYRLERDGITNIEELVMVSSILQPYDPFNLQEGPVLARFNELARNNEAVSAQIDQILETIWTKNKQKVEVDLETNLQSAFDKILYEFVKSDELIDPDEYILEASARMHIKIAVMMANESFFNIYNDTPNDLAAAIHLLGVSKEYVKILSTTWATAKFADNFKLQCRAYLKSSEAYLQKIQAIIQNTAATMLESKNQPLGLYVPGGVENLDLDDVDYGLYHGKIYTMHVDVPYLDLMAALASNDPNEIEIITLNPGELNERAEDIGKYDYGQLITDGRAMHVEPIVHPNVARYVLDAEIIGPASYLARIMRPSKDGKWRAYVEHLTDQ